MAEVIHDREMEWRSYKGYIKIKDMEDIHVINVVHMLAIRIKKAKDSIKQLENSVDDELGLHSLRLEYREETLKTLSDIFDNFKAEMGFRNLSFDLLGKAPYPFEDETGCVRLWDEESKKFNIKSPSVRFSMED